jgi:hypothetical protein
VPFISLPGFPTPLFCLLGCQHTANLHVTSQCANHPTPRLGHPESHPFATEICHDILGIEAQMYIIDIIIIIIIIMTLGAPRTLWELADTYLNKP